MDKHSSVGRIVFIRFYMTVAFWYQKSTQQLNRMNTAFYFPKGRWVSAEVCEEKSLINCTDKILGEFRPVI